MASGRQVEYQLRLNSNAVSVFGQADAAANKFDNSMWQVQKTLASFGLGLGAHFLIDAAKNWTQAAADYEQAMLRIRNVSEKGFEVLNQDFMKSQVDKFKLNLEDISQSYGMFLFKMKNARMSNEEKNKLFEELNIIGKIGGLSQEQMKSTLYQTSLLLGEGVLEARHLRPLTQQHPNLIPYIADELGLKDKGEKDKFSELLSGEENFDKAQRLSQLITKQITKLGISSIDVLIPAYEKYTKDLLKNPEKLSEALHTVQSELNVLESKWYEFKTSMVLDQKPELLNFFNSLKDSIHWLSEHEEQIISFGKTLFHMVEVYAIWKTFLFGLQAPLAIIGFFRNELLSLNSIISAYSSLFGTAIVETELSTAAKVKETKSLGTYISVLIEGNNIINSFITSTQLKTASILEEITAIEAESISLQKYNALLIEGVSAIQLYNAASAEQIFSQQALGSGRLLIGSGLSKPAGKVSNGLGVEYIAYEESVAASTAATASETAATSSILGGLTFASGALVVGLTAASIYELGQILQKVNRTDKQETLDYNQRMSEIMLGEKVIKSWDKSNPLYSFKTLEEQDRENNEFGNGKIADIAGGKVWTFIDMFKNFGENPFNDPFHHPTNSGKTNFTPPGLTKPEHIRGNSSNYFTVNIHEMNGMKNPKFEEVNGATMVDVKQEVGIEVTRMMLEVINDIQIVHQTH